VKDKLEGFIDDLGRVAFDCNRNRRGVFVTEDHRNQQLRVWLAEYQACHLNRDHYHGLAWITGSIFIAGSLALLGTSFLDPVVYDPRLVLFMGDFSIVLFIVWVVYLTYVQHFATMSLERARKIEKEIQSLDFDIRLHTDIEATRHWRGRWNLVLLWIVVLVAWITRILLSLATIPPN